MNLTNIRLVTDKDDGGIRQSERQYIPQLKQLGVTVIGVVLGDEYGNYSDQRADFNYCFNKKPSSYEGDFFSKLRSTLSNAEQSRATANLIFKEIGKELRGKKIDLLVISVRRVNLIPVAIKLAGMTGGKVIYHSGESFRRGPLGINYIVYWYLRKISRLKILANSRFSANSYKLNPDNYVYPGVSTNRISSDSNFRCIRSELGIGDRSPVFLFLARVNWDKAPDLLLKGFLDSIQAMSSDAHLIIAGPVQDPSLETKLNEIVNEANASNRVHIVGKQSDVANWYRSADVFVNSRRGVEPFGISIVEAMAAGLPILSSALGGPSETVKDSLNGWLIHDLTTSGYEEGIDRAINFRDKWAVYGNNSRELSRDFTVESQVIRYLNHCIYKK